MIDPQTPYREEFAIRIKADPTLKDGERKDFQAGPQSFGDLDGSVSFVVVNRPQLFIWDEDTTEQQIMAFYEWLRLAIPEAQKWVEVISRRTGFWDERSR